MASSRSASAAVRFSIASRVAAAAPGAEGADRACSLAEEVADVTGIVSAAPASPARFKRSRRETPFLFDMRRSLNQRFRGFQRFPGSQRRLLWDDWNDWNRLK